MKWLLNNFWLKIIAFIMGLLLWIHVATEKTYNYELRLPVTEVMLKPGLALSKEPPDSILVAVAASGKQLLRRQWRQQGLRINASQFQAGRYSMTLSTANTFLANQTDPVALDEVVSPVSVPLEIDVEATEDVAIEHAVETVPDDGFAIGRQIVVEPASAKLIGPRSLLSEITRIETESRQLEGLRSTVSVRLALISPPRYGFHIEPDSVTVTIPVVPVKTRVFSDLPVIILNAPPDTSVSADPNSLNVEITGPPDDIDLLNRNALSVSVDYRKRDDDGLAPVKVESPPKFSLRKASSDSVRLVVSPNADSRN